MDMDMDMDIDATLQIDLLALDHLNAGSELLHLIWSEPRLIKLGVGLLPDIVKLRSSYPTYFREPVPGVLELNQMYQRLYPYHYLVGGISLSRVCAPNR
jgi:hypothetical protein